MSTRNGTDRPRSAGPITRFTSRAWNRIAIRPGASPSTAACSASVQTPDGAHWFLLICDVQRRPEVIVEGAPHSVVAIKGNRVIHPHVPGGRDHVVDVSLEAEL